MSTRKCRRYKVEYLENIQGDTYHCCEFIHIQTAQKAVDEIRTLNGAANVYIESVFYDNGRYFEEFMAGNKIYV